MPQVEQLTETLVERSIKELGLQYLKDPDGDLRVSFARDDDSGRELTAWIQREGTERHILLVRVLADHSVSKNDFARVIMLCNAWNSTRRWPSAFLYGTEGQELKVASEGQVVLEFQIDCGKGIHSELVTDICGTTIACAHQFWTWAHGEQGL